MTVRLREVGNSMTITIPKNIVKQFQLTQGIEVSIEAQEDYIMVKPVKARNKVTIKSLFQDYSGDYKPSEIDWGEDRGKELW